VESVARDDTLAVRALVESDIPLMARWLSDPQVLRYYEGRDQSFDEDRVREKYFAAERSKIEQLLVLYENSPIGYAQIYPLDADERADYGYTDTRSGGALYGIDLFIGETACWDRGIGTRLVALLTRHAVEAHGAAVVTLDPRVENARAVRCYQKAGYRIVKRLPARELHEGAWRDCWLMEWRSGDGQTPVVDGDSDRS